MKSDIKEMTRAAMIFLALLWAATAWADDRDICGPYMDRHGEVQMVAVCRSAETTDAEIDEMMERTNEKHRKKLSEMPPYEQWRLCREDEPMERYCRRERKDGE